MIKALQQYGLYLGWIVSIIATGGSLYFSKVLEWVPCELCWYQRIFMYPLVMLLAIATYKNDRKLIPYLFPLTATGGLISLFHYLEQQIPALASAVTCQSGVPCHMKYMELFGFVTIPLLALFAFILITIFLWLAREK